MSEAWQGYSAAQRLRHGDRAAVRAALLAARDRTLAWADQQLGASALPLPVDERLNPPLWELGHVGWFQEWWIARNRERHRGARCDPQGPRSESLLSGADAWYDSSRVAHATRWDLDLPSPTATRDYLAATLAATLDRLDALPHDAGDDALYFFRLVALHEEMHAEAAGMMWRLVTGRPLPQRHAAGAPALPATLQVPAQRFEVGSGTAGFAFDNELGRHAVDLAAFEIDAAPVSWARYRAFIDAGGYAQPAWWSEAGWAWRTGRPVPRPGPDGAPAVHLSAYEAQAWCRWAGRRLPTEAEWECAALTQPAFRWGGPDGVWEWTASAFEPYPGFVPHPYTDYSAPWFGSRRVLRGASATTAPALAHPRYRNFYEPGRNDVFAGFRSCAGPGLAVAV